MSLQSRAVTMTKQMIQIESTDPGTYENAMADWITTQLAPYPNVRLSRQEVLPGRPNLIAELTGDPSLPALVMICHMDTVVVGDGWTLPPFDAIEKDGKIYGRGACDMKSGLACCLSAFQYAAETLQTSGKTPKQTLKLICSMDEEDFMRGSEACIQAGWVTDHDWVIDAEPTNGQIQMAHKGRMKLMCRDTLPMQARHGKVPMPLPPWQRLFVKSDMRFCMHRFTLIWEVPRSLSGRSPAVIVPMLCQITVKSGLTCVWFHP